MGVRRTLNLAPVLQVGARSREEARGGRYRPQPVADPHPGTRCGGHPLLEALPPPPPVATNPFLRWRLSAGGLSLSTAPPSTAATPVSAANPVAVTMTIQCSRAQK